MLSGGAAIGAYLSKDGITYITDTLLHPNEREERQQILDQLVEAYPLPHLCQAYYDPDKEILAQAPSTYPAQIVANPEYRELIFRLLISEMQNSTPYSEDGIVSQLEEAIRLRVEEAIRNVPDECALTLYYTPLFGKGAPSHIYLFKSAFEDRVRELDGKPFIMLGEEKIKVVYIHERFHAQQYSEGLDFGDGLVIDNANYSSINPMVRDFLIESSAYMDTFDFFRQSRGDELALIYSAYEIDWVFDNCERLVPYIDTFTQYEKRLLKAQVIRLDKIIPEIRGVLLGEPVAEPNMP